MSSHTTANLHHCIGGRVDSVVTLPEKAHHRLGMDYCASRRVWITKDPFENNRRATLALPPTSLIVS